MPDVQELWGGETAKAIENFPISGETVPVAVVHWLARIKGAAAAVNGELGLLSKRGGGPDREGGGGDRRRRARRPVPDRRLPDRLGHLDEHERQRGDRASGRCGRAPQRPGEHGPVLQRRVPLRRAPGGARRRPERAPARAEAARTLARAQGPQLPGRRQVGAHAPDGRRAGDARTGVRRLRGADRARAGAHRRGARPRRPDPARRHRHRARA